MHSHLWRARIVGLLVAVAAVAGCADTQPSTDDPPAEPQASEEEPPTEGSDAGVEAVDVAIIDGQAQTDRNRVDVALGTTVRIQVQADVDEEIHVHGYDLSAPVTPTEPGVLEFTADIPGAFEVEAEHSGLELFQLRVR